jgi:hypothetical protein
MGQSNLVRVEMTVKNGVKVKVAHFEGGGTSVEATCHCFGHPLRTHSNPYCPNLNPSK